jgi:hypothetical protein
MAVLLEEVGFEGRITTHHPLRPSATAGAERSLLRSDFGGRFNQMIELVRIRASIIVGNQLVVNRSHL